MFILILIFIILGTISLMTQVSSYEKYVSLNELYKETEEEGKQLKKEAEEIMNGIECSQGGNCTFILEDKTVEPLAGWGDTITGHYKCSKCGDTRDEIIQHPN